MNKKVPFAVIAGALAASALVAPISGAAQAPAQVESGLYFTNPEGGNGEFYSFTKWASLTPTEQSNLVLKYKPENIKIFNKVEDKLASLSATVTAESFDGAATAYTEGDIEGTFVDATTGDKIVVAPVVEEVTVESVMAINDTTVEFGTAVADLEFPATVTATLNDEEATEVELAVDWAENADYNGNVAGEYTFTGTLTLPEDAEYTISEELKNITSTVTVATPTEAQIAEAVGAINTADAAGIIAALQSPVLGLKDIDEDLAAEYVAEVLNSVTNTPARIQAAVNRVNAQAAADAEADAEAEQLLVDAVNEALNFNDLRDALLRLEPTIKLAPAPIFNQLYFDAIDTNTTETREQILAVINTVNKEQLTALVVKAETDLTQGAYDAAKALVIDQDLLEEAVQTELEDRLAVVQTKIATQILVDDVNASVTEDDLEAALQALETEELIEGYVTADKTAYFTTFEEITENPKFTTVAEIQAFVDEVNSDVAQALIDEVNDAGAEDDAADFAEKINLAGVTTVDANANDDAYLAAFKAKVDEDDNFKFTTVEEITEFVQAVDKAETEKALVGAINTANESDRAGLPDAVKAFVNEYGNDKYINLKVANREEVFGFFHVETMNTELETATEVQTALNTAIDTYKGFLTGVNAATTTTEARAALQVWVDQAIAAYGDYTTAESKIAELGAITNSNGKVTIEAATKLIEATEIDGFDGFQTINEVLTAATSA